MQRKKKRIFRGGAGLSPALCARLDSQALCLPCRKQENSPTPIVTPYRMASLWENLAPTTHSLTPRPQNRPLKIGKLTPCKIPGVAGSAGHCEPGQAPFLGAYPFSCCEITPLSTAWFWGICYERWRNFVMACRPAFSSLPRAQRVLQAATFGNCCP